MSHFFSQMQLYSVNCSSFPGYLLEICHQLFSADLIDAAADSISVTRYISDLLLFCNKLISYKIIEIDIYTSKL